VAAARRAPLLRSPPARGRPSSRLVRLRLLSSGLLTPAGRRGGDARASSPSSFLLLPLLLHPSSTGNRTGERGQSPKHVLSSKKVPAPGSLRLARCCAGAKGSLPGSNWTTAARKLTCSIPSGWESTSGRASRVMGSNPLVESTRLPFARAPASVLARQARPIGRAGVAGERVEAQTADAKRWERRMRGRG
jgi:hypothetical protein